MPVLHFEQTPYRQNLFGVSEEEIQGKFDGWQKNAKYVVTLKIVLEVDGTNVSTKEYTIAPGIYFQGNTALLFVNKTFSFEGTFSEFQDWYATQESSLQYYIDALLNDLNSARRQAGLFSSWYVNYGLDDREIEVHKP